MQAAVETGREPDWDRLVTGVLLVALGVVWFLSTIEVVSPNWQILLPLALIAVGALSLVLALSGRSADLVGTGILLTVLVVLTSVFPSNPSWRIGEQDVRPTSAADVERRYSHGIGNVTLDLRSIRLERDLDVEVSNGIGELVVRVPEGVALEVDARAGVGDVSVDDREADGFNARLEESLPGDGPTLRLELSTGIGEVRVER